MGRNPEVNSDTHQPLEFCTPIDGRLPTVSSPTINVLTGEPDSDVYVQYTALPIPPEEISLTPGRQIIIGGNAEINSWRIRSKQGRQDYEVILHPRYGPESEEKLLEIYDSSESFGLKRVEYVNSLTRAVFNPKDGLSLVVGNHRLFSLHPENGTNIHPQLRQGNGSSSDLYEYHSNFTSMPYDFGCIGVLFQLGEYNEIGGVEVEGPITNSYYILSGIRFTSFLPEVLEKKLLQVIDSGIESPTQIRPIFDVYTELLDAPKL